MLNLDEAIPRSWLADDPTLADSGSAKAANDEVLLHCAGREAVRDKLKNHTTEHRINRNVKIERSGEWS